MMDFKRSVSYLNARDPSIYMGRFDDRIKGKLYSSEILEESLEDSITSQSSFDSTSVEKEENNLQVFLRIKSEFSPKLYEIDENTLICKVPEKSHVMRNMRNGENMTKKYTFSKILDPKVTQLQLFDDTVKAKIVDFLNGTNTTLLTYGASGSGKTFTIVGTPDDPGLIPRSLEYLFRSLPNLSKIPRTKPLPNGSTVNLVNNEHIKYAQVANELINSFMKKQERNSHIKTYTDMQRKLSGDSKAIVDQLSDVTLNIWVSFAEIYNENIYDLLVPPPTRNKPRPKLSLGNANNLTYIEDLTCIPVSSGVEAYEILQFGLHHLNYAATAVNSHSSRSHCIFTIKLVQSGRNGAHISYFNFCDLAGSERLKKTGNVGDRLKESNNINKSLSVLSRCISAIRECSQNNKDLRDQIIPFRESKLTRLFQNALSGHENMCMIINMNPSLDMFDETHHVLNFSAIAKDVIIERPKKDQNLDDISKNSDYELNRSSVEYYKNLVAELQLQLELQRDQYEQSIEDERERLQNGYKNIMEQKEKMLRDEYEDKIKNLKKYYEFKLSNQNKTRDEVICLESSDEEDDSDKENFDGTFDSEKSINLDKEHRKRTLSQSNKSVSSNPDDSVDLNDSEDPIVTKKQKFTKNLEEENELNNKNNAPKVIVTTFD